MQGNMIYNRFIFQGQWDSTSFFFLILPQDASTEIQQRYTHSISFEPLSMCATKFSNHDPRPNIFTTI